MRFKTYLLDEDRGVSPVIGVILMVAITVILAAVIATFVMNMGPPEETMPNAQFSWEEQSGGGYNLIHDGGEAVSHSQVTSSSSTIPTGASLTEATGDEWTATDVVVSSVSSGTTVKIIWENPNSDETQVLFSGEAP